MNKLSLTATVFVLGLSGAAYAQAELDADGDGVMSFNELLAGYPTLTEETFTAIDANADGAVDADEMQAAVDAGLLTAG